MQVGRKEATIFLIKISVASYSNVKIGQADQSTAAPSLCPTGYNMSTFIRRYSRYLNEKAMSYRLAAVDFTKMKRG